MENLNVYKSMRRYLDVNMQDRYNDISEKSVDYNLKAIKEEIRRNREKRENKFNNKNNKQL